MESRIAVVTGAGRGIGRAVTHALLADGWTVAGCGRHRDPLVETLGDQSGAAFTLDVSDEASVRAGFAEIVDRFGRIDLLFNNAGISGPSGSVDEIGVDEWNACLAVNVTGSMLCAAAAVRQMKAQDPQGGRIINNGSISAHTPRPRQAAYAVSKHAISGLTKSIELDGRGFGITCGQIDIGNTATDMMARMSDGSLQPDGSMKVEPTFPVAEAARTVAFMASLPPSVSPNHVLITAAGMPFVGRG